MWCLLHCDPAPRHRVPTSRCPTVQMSPMFASAKPPPSNPLLPQHNPGPPKCCSPSPAPVVDWEPWIPRSWAPALAIATPQLPPRPGRNLAPLGRCWCCRDEDGHGDTAGKGTPRFRSPALCQYQVTSVPPRMTHWDPQGMHSKCRAGSWEEARRVCSISLPPKTGLHPCNTGKRFSFSFYHRNSETLTPAHLPLPSHLPVLGLLEELLSPCVSIATAPCTLAR